MDSALYYRAMEAFCRQRAKMDEENDKFWLAEAEVSAKCFADAHRRKVVMHPTMQNKNPASGQGC
jgi:hypothetical protein